MVHGDNYDANPAADDKHFTYSPTKEPDGTAYHRAPGGKHIIYDTKVWHGPLHHRCWNRHDQARRRHRCLR